MRNTKKFISVLLACVIVLSSLAVSAFAWTGDGTQQFKIELTADKEYVKAGDTVTFTAVANLSTDATFNAFGAYMFSFMFNNTVLTPVSYEYGPTIADYSLARGYAVVTIATALNNVKAKCTADEQAAWDTNGYNAMFRIQAAKDSKTTYGAQGYWEMGEDEVLFKVTFKVADGVADGTPVHFDCLSGLLAMKYFYVQSIDTANGNKGTNQITPNLYDWAGAKSNVVTGEATAASILQWSKAQIRFKGITQDGAKADYQGTFDVRTVAKISEADFIAKFGSDEAAKSAITDLGFVYMINGESFDYATAVEVANGASATGYTKKSVSYIQHAGAGEDYIFTCLITDNPDAAKNDTLTCIAFVKTADETIVFDAPSTVNYSELYGLMPA